MTVLVIGGTGTTGSRVAGQLGARGQLPRIASRRGSESGSDAGFSERVRFDWYDPSTHRDAVEGVHAMYVLAPVGEPDPAPIMTPFLHLAAQAGVRRAVLLSSSAIAPGTPGLGAVHTALGELFGQWAVLRPSWFMENFVESHPHARSVRDHGEIVSATGEGRVGFVAAEDIAAVAVAALLDATPHNTDHVLTGPEALSYDEVAAILSEVTGSPVRHRRVSPAELADRLGDTGLPVGFARLLADLDDAIAGGAEDRTTSTVARLTGREPRSFRDVVSAALANAGHSSPLTATATDGKRAP